ncbi:hypothetical protein NP493_142g03003 [Ridgeia piscesae]|uniref:G-protein coupled receptors family 1 profile domain-containing protein n=1 Tax=Ridgeia piscesae TaxID=27915 RepID=A0AAD9P563_RIDPI|nr:hypothetical protein NP493_142g03003 [Ridgeia piscesae]
MTAVTETGQNDSRGSDAGGTQIPTVRILVCLGLFIIIIITILGNVVVVAAFVIEKKLRNTFTFYILNLAITDVCVAVTAMTFYTFDILLGWWPFGEVLCGFWIFFDYGMTFASVFTLVAISVDRFWSVQWSLHYRQHNTMRKTTVVIVVIWIAVVVVWLAPCVVDRIRWSEPNVCKWEPSKNREFVIFVAIVGHHLPDVIMIFCFIRVFAAMRKRRLALRSAQATCTPSQSVTTSAQPDPASKQCVQNSQVLPEKVQTSTSKVASLRAVVTVDTISGNIPSSSNPSTGMTSAASEQHERLKRDQDRYNQERKAFVTLTYIIFSYLACWVPFHFVFDISAIDPARVPEVIYTITFWLTYFNSTVNPFLYAYSNKDFQNAFKRVIKGQF